MDYKKVEMKMDSGNQHSYFQEDIDGIFLEPLFDELDLNIFVDEYHGHYTLTGRSVKGLIYMVGPTPTT